MISPLSSSLSTGLAGVQKGMSSLDQSAAVIARSATGSASSSTLTQNLVQMQAASQQVQASVAVVRTADQTLGLLVDTRA